MPKGVAIENEAARAETMKSNGNSQSTAGKLTVTSIVGEERLFFVVTQNSGDADGRKAAQVGVDAVAQTGVQSQKKLSQDTMDRLGVALGVNVEAEHALKARVDNSLFAHIVNANANNQKEDLGKGAEAEIIQRRIGLDQERQDLEVIVEATGRTVKTLQDKYNAAEIGTHSDGQHMEVRDAFAALSRALDELKTVEQRIDQISNEDEQTVVVRDDMIAEVEERREAYLAQVLKARRAYEGRSEVKKEAAAGVVLEALGRFVVDDLIVNGKVKVDASNIEKLEETMKAFKDCGYINAFIESLPVPEVDRSYGEEAKPTLVIDVPRKDIHPDILALEFLGVDVVTKELLAAEAKGKARADRAIEKFEAKAAKADEKRVAGVAKAKVAAAKALKKAAATRQNGLISAQQRLMRKAITNKVTFTEALAEKNVMMRALKVIKQAFLYVAAAFRTIVDKLNITKIAATAHLQLMTAHSNGGVEISVSGAGLVSSVSEDDSPVAVDKPRKGLEPTLSWLLGKDPDAKRSVDGIKGALAAVGRTLADADAQLKKEEAREHEIAKLCAIFGSSIETTG